MIKSLKLEWLKVKYHPLIWILFGMYLLALTILCFGGTFFLEWLKYEGEDFHGLDPTLLPIYDFPDIWQNVTSLASLLRVFPAFIVIISVTNDITTQTLRQNVIDGISKTQYLTSKIALIVSLSVLSTAFIGLAVLINGKLYAHPASHQLMIEGATFLVAYAFDALVYCCLAFLLALLIKKPGFLIMALALYTIWFEPIAAAILRNHPDLRDTAWVVLPDYFPVSALNGLIQLPFGRYLFHEITDFVPVKQLIITTAWLLSYLSGIIFLLTRRDLK
ncbi:hypothetical protein [Marinoscillum furvescens]|uniref:ABC-2 family transporter n=1 Tax=Marinoscillum furvescens DSM 4134 TaxID=1122208 RepID=A0A3D9L2W4_MARFU|nr:hypothetical protein [Marinoscillum furvescens]RED99456.1 hypothetical protein C7460_10872 [Marinoscillum furvescens DSM 4134]